MVMRTTINLLMKMVRITIQMKIKIIMIVGKLNPSQEEKRRGNRNYIMILVVTLMITLMTK